MKMIRGLAMIAAMAAALVMGGCANVPMGAASEDAKLKQFDAPKAGTAGVYIYRNETFGAAVKLPVVIDGSSVGQTGPKTYFFTEVAPGNHSVVSQAENTSTVTFDAVAGKLYYVWQEVKMGLMQPRTLLHVVSDTEGQKGVGESSLAASMLPPGKVLPAAPSVGSAR